MRFEAEIRRSEPDETPLPPSDPVLVALLRAEIDASGPITFARFMEIALADPGHGYYATSDDRPTRSGDFLTAPELHPIFGATIARSLDEQWRALDRPDPFVFMELGAGSGTLALDVLRGLAAGGSGLVEALCYEPIELLPARVARIRERIEAAGFRHPAAGAPVEGAPVEAAADGQASLPGGAQPRSDRGAFLANEFFDALPVHRVEERDGRLVELFVGWSTDAGGTFVEVPGEPSTPALAERFAAEGVGLSDGQRAEVCLELDRWIELATGRFERGFGLVIDYGREARDLYGPGRAGGTLRAYWGHHAHADPFVAIGHQDITAHVDFTAIERAAAGRGWRTAGLTTQAEFLAGSGLGELLGARQADPTLEASDYLALRASVMRLLDPAALGGFRVLVLGRGLPDDTRLAGLTYQVRR
jgi:SAM-dependent MidA family methyltransferase